MEVSAHGEEKEEKIKKRKNWGIVANSMPYINLSSRC